jgi:hypothetical protein
MHGVLIWYWLGGRKVLNFGEHFVEMLLPKLHCHFRRFDVEKERGAIEPGEPFLLVIGSEFERGLVDGLLAAGCHVHVWGQGNGRGADRAVDVRLPHYRAAITIHALRGPLTKRVSHVEADVPLCDPGFLLPKFYPNWKVEEPTGVAYIPHHCNYELVTLPQVQAVGADCLLNVMVHHDELCDLASRIASASFALVSSLHAFIFCLAYGVPCAICLQAGEVLNMPDKWRDVLESTGWPDRGEGSRGLPIVHNLAQGRRWWEREGRQLEIPDVGAMLAAFPFGEDP